ncbi:putative membrane protein [Escherichia coli DEC3B]|nr:putative membrane protein [Escherichia coli DEC3B]EHW78324.1 putative membrane protein [Escherichia coli DEC10C]
MAFSLLTVSVVLAVLNDIIDWSVLFLLLQSFFYYFEVQLEI